MDKIKLCVFCNYFYFSPAIPDYSEVTPGEDAEVGCAQGKWQMDNFEGTTAVFRTNLETASTCPLFDPVDCWPEYNGEIKVTL